MSLQVWLPLTYDYQNNGIYNVSVSTSGSPSFATGGKIGKALSITSDSSAVYLTNFMSTLSTYTTYTMAAWIYMESVATNHSSSILSTGNWNSGTGQLCFGFYDYSSGYAKLLVPNLSSWSDGISLSSRVQLNKWYHVCISYDGQITRGYINGQYVGQYAGGGITKSSESNNLGVGRATYYSGFTLHGKMNDIRIYDNALSAAEIKDIAKGLVLHYPLNDAYVEPTTNIVPNSDTFSGWSPYSNGYTSITDNELGVKSCVITSKTSWCGIYKTGITVPSTGTYTLSVWCKPISRSSTAINQTLYFSGGGFSDNSTSVSWAEPGKWTRISMTRTFTNTNSVTLYLIAYGGAQTSDYTVSCEYTMPQIEKIDHATPYTPSTRAETVIHDASGYKYDGTVAGNLQAMTPSPRNKYCTFWPTASSAANTIHTPVIYQSGEAITMSIWVKTTATGGQSYQMPFESNSRCYCEMSITSGGQLRGGLYVGGTRYVQNVGSGLLDGSWHMISITYDGATIKRYIDGVSQGSTTVSGTLNNQEQSYWLGVLGTDTAYYNSNIYQADARLYATALSETDILALYNSPIKITKNGTLITNGEIIE